MFRLNFKIALRNLWRNKGYAAINISGLAIGLAGFILVMVYVNYETGYDAKNPNLDNIYLIGRDQGGVKTNLTPSPLARQFQDKFPEIISSGRMKVPSFEVSVFSKNGVVYLKNFVSMDYSLAKIMGINPAGGLQKPSGMERQVYLPEVSAVQLFPSKKEIFNEGVFIGSKNGSPAVITGVIKKGSEHSSVEFDALAVGLDISSTVEGYGDGTVLTYIQVRPGTDIRNLAQKIDQVYHKGMVSELGAEADQRMAGQQVIFLDPFKNQHLRPAYASNINYKIVVALSTLSMLILIIACINFTNLTISQANVRAKEVGVKKVLGAKRSMLIMQFFAEIFVQCLIAVLMALVLAEILFHPFNQLFQLELSIWSGSAQLLWQIPAVLVLITILAGIYPSLVLSGYRPAAVLKGNLQTSHRTLWFRNSLLVIQFVIAIVFISGVLVINRQVQYIKTQDTGFNASQVVSVKNMVLYNKAADFAALRAQILKMPGVKNVTVASAIPDGGKSPRAAYTVQGREYMLDITDIGYGYFETLGIKLKEGRLFSDRFTSDTLNSAILNESAARQLNLSNPIGKTITGCKKEYQVVGVVKDVKVTGFESPVAPAVYLMNNQCGNFKINIMVRIEENHMAEVLALLKKDWHQLNKKDGENFRYEFLDQVYGKIFVKQEQLQSVFFSFAMLTIFIALLGLFAFAAYTTSKRLKEISIRKILGASNIQILVLLNNFFLRMVIIANLIGLPVTYVLSKKWLESFAYRIDTPVLPFVLAGVFSVLLTLIIVSVQAGRSVRANPAEALKYE